jgi:two-component system, OmpR family, phosphate regulon sensor histidine kinase PhoR
VTESGPTQAAHFDLPLPELPSPTAQAKRARASRYAAALPAHLLARNAFWFCQLRWLVIAALASFGVAGRFKPLMDALGLLQPGVWPFVAAAVLAVSNTLFLVHTRVLRRRPSPGPAKANLWAQIVVDLVVLTAVVHFVGSTQTFVAFTFLFHIALACIFFPRRESLLVTALAGGLYAACTLMERQGWLPPGGIFAEGVLGGATSPSMMGWLVSVGMAVAIWGVVWYLISQLSTLVRRRDIQLAQTNERLVAAQEERRRHMLTTTHELKAPLAAIQANAQLLFDGYCGDMSDKAMEVLERVTARCRRLTTEIQEMLELANLTSTSQEKPVPGQLDPAELLQWAVDHAAAIAQDREVHIDTDLQPVTSIGVAEHLRMMLGNLVTNAVIYSDRGGRVTVTCRPGDDGATVMIADEGIGIAPEKLPRVFEEHFRTNQAVQHNRESSGLGLAIVRRIVEDHRIHLRVESQLGVGTTFRLQFPPAQQPSPPHA